MEPVGAAAAELSASATENEGGGAAAPALPAALAVATKTPAGARGAGKRGGTEATKVKREGADDDEDELFKKLAKTGAKVKTDFLRCVSTADELAKMIHSQAEWRWAVGNEAGEMRLSGALGVLRSKVTEWAQQFLLSDFASIKRAYPRSRIQVELTTFVQLADDIAVVNRVVRQLLAATAAMSAA